MIINLISILLTTSGTIMMYFFSPKIDSQKYLFNKSEMTLRKVQDEKNNLRLKQGFYLIVIGIMFQILALLNN
jgi:hypothetical protein